MFTSGLRMWAHSGKGPKDAGVQWASQSRCTIYLLPQKRSTLASTLFIHLPTLVGFRLTLTSIFSD